MEIEWTRFEYASGESQCRKFVLLITKDMTLVFTAMKQLKIDVLNEIRELTYLLRFIIHTTLFVIVVKINNFIMCFYLQITK